MKFEIRRTRQSIDDATIIHRFIVELATYEREPDAVEATPQSILAQLKLDPPPFECLIAEANGDPLGFALFFFNYSTWKGRPGIYIEDIFVPPSLRHKGIGKALLREVAQIATDRNCGRMEWSVLNWNTPAIEFYKTLGATPMDEWTTFRLTGEELSRLGKKDRA